MVAIRRSRASVAVLVLAALLIAAFAARAAFARTAASVGRGVVVIDTNLGYQGGQAAGTGMVLTSSGEVLTNNHVINGATQIVAVVPGTSHHYVAKVVGYSVSDDVAILQLQHVAGLKTVSATQAKAAIGDPVHAVGNAGGRGTLSTTYGTITALAKTITASNDAGASETLRGLLEVAADVQPGDSGGPLLDDSGRVVGMTTAASRGNFGYGYAANTSPDAYAIPIGKALSVAKLIETGKSSATIHIGATAFLGVEVGSAERYGLRGAIIGGLVPNGPAAKAGLQTGDVITRLGSTTIASPRTITNVVLSKKPGATLSVTYRTPYSGSKTVAVTLGSGPPQ